MIPEGWKAVKFTDVGELRHGFQFREHHFSLTGIPIVKIGNLVDFGSVDLSKSSFVPSNLANQFSSFVVHAGDILMALTGGTLGKISRVQADIPLAFQNYRVGNFREISTQILNRDYLYFFLCSPIVQGRIADLVNEAAQPNIGKGDFDKIQMPLPPLPEQRRIAEILATWDRAIETLGALIANARDQKTALMQSLLTGKHRLPGFSGVWTTQKLGSLCQISKGEQLGRLAMIETGTIPVINGGITASGYTDRANSPADCITISEGGNSCGFVSMIDKPFWSGGHCYALKKLVADRSFLFASLKHREDEIMTLRVGSGLPNIQKKALAGFELNVPPRAEQEAIGKFAGTQDGVLVSLQSQLTALRQEKAALMQQLLTGKRRVKLTEREAA